MVGSPVVTDAANGIENAADDVERRAALEILGTREGHRVALDSAAGDDTPIQRMQGRRLLDVMVMVHGGLGTLALLAGLGAALAPKRRGWHVLSGRVFAVTLLVSLLAIAGPILLRRNVFMMGLGAVAWFAIIEGWRALRRYRGTLQAAPDIVDYAVVAVTGAMAVGLAIFGLWVLVRTANPLAAVCLGFAALAGVLLWASIRRWRAEVTRRQWLAVHIGHMSGALGAAVTAAAVVNLEGWFGSWQWVLWVGPTVVSTVWGQRAIRARGLTRVDAASS
jgi:hypothetical protein